MIFFDIHLDMKFDRTQKNSSFEKSTINSDAATAAEKMNESGKG